MDWLSFFASIVGSLAWPLTIVAGFFILRDNLLALFPFIERFKYKDFEVEFRRSVQELTAQSRTVLPVQEAEDDIPQDPLYALAEVSPRSAILEAWLQVETAGAEALQSSEPKMATRTSMIAPLRLGEYLRRREIISGQQLEIFHRLRELRNKAVHVGDVTFQLDEVAEYIALATSLAAQIRKTAPRGA